MTLSQYRNKLTQLQGARESLLSNKKYQEEKTEDYKKELIIVEKAREVVKQVAILTQNQLEYKLSEIVTLALQSILDEPYELKLNFVQQRNKTEANLMFKIKDKEISYLELGGGVVDIASLGLRLALWSLQSKRSRPVIILDEPFKMLSKSYGERASNTLRLLSEKLGIQLIMVTHNAELMDCGNNIYTITQTQGVSTIKGE
jgi:ABC-type glutathione transport system ATPase component